MDTHDLRRKCKSFLIYSFGFGNPPALKGFEPILVQNYLTVLVPHSTTRFCNPLLLIISGPMCTLCWLIWRTSEPCGFSGLRVAESHCKSLNISAWNPISFGQCSLKIRKRLRLTIILCGTYPKHYRLLQLTTFSQFFFSQKDKTKYVRVFFYNRFLHILVWFSCVPRLTRVFIGYRLTKKKKKKTL